MKNQLWISVLLFVSGAVAAGIGAAMLFTPVDFHATSGIVLGDNISLLNEMRAMGGGLIGAGLLAIAGAFVSRLRFAALMIAGILNLSYGLARLVSINIDGIPSTTLVTATGVELAVALMCLAALAFVPPQSSKSF